MTKKYIFVLCPPQQGSTIIVNLLDSSKSVSSFLSQDTWAGESQWLIKDNGDPLYDEKRWDPNYEINMDIIKNIFDIYLDKNKTVFVEKSPPTICRAQKFQDYFSQFGEVYFIISIRNPYSTKYSAERWVEYAKYQKKNIETLKNTILTRYEDICVNLDQFILRIKNTFPELSDIHNHDNANLKNERGQKIHAHKINRIINKEQKNKTLMNHLELLHYFGYNFIK